MSDREAEYFVAGELSLLVLSYLNEQRYTLPSLRRVLLEFPRGSRMPIKTWWQLLNDLYSQERNPNLGIDIGRHVQLFHSGVLGYLIAQNETMQEALLCFQRYQTLLHNYGPVILREESNLISVTWDYLGKRSTLTSDKVFVSSMIYIAKKLSGEFELTPAEVRFQHEADHAGADTEALLGCPVVFGADALEIRFPVRLLDFVMRANDPYLLEIMGRQADALLSDTNAKNQFLVAVENCIVSALSAGTPEADAVAAKLNMSRRTLHRKLRDNGMNFHHALRNTRLKLAKMYLKDANLSLSEVAFLLGYSEQSAFNRAFKLWVGESPGTYREGVGVSQ